MVAVDDLRPAYCYKCVIRPEDVVDGDTVDCEIDLGMQTFRLERLRLWGINAPEVRGEQKVEGKRATAHLIKLLERHALHPGGGFIIRTYKDKRGKYGRFLAEIIGVKKNGEALNLNKEMVRTGYAVYATY
jgi:micrococcal nuclease